MLDSKKSLHLVRERNPKTKVDLTRKGTGQPGAGGPYDDPVVAQAASEPLVLVISSNELHSTLHKHTVGTSIY